MATDIITMIIPPEETSTGVGIAVIMDPDGSDQYCLWAISKCCLDIYSYIEARPVNGVRLPRCANCNTPWPEALSETNSGLELDPDGIIRIAECAAIWVDEPDLELEVDW